VTVTIGGGNSSASCFLHALTAASVSKKKKVVRKGERNPAKRERSDRVFERTIAYLFFQTIGSGSIQTEQAIGGECLQP
jgi:hypothetical protein